MRASERQGHSHRIAAPATSDAPNRGATRLDHSAKTFTIETRTGPESFTLWQGAEVTGPDARKSFDALAVGEFVAVRSIQDENERWLARSVQVVNPNELEGQLADAPAFDEADTVTVTSVDRANRILHVQTVGGPRSYQLTEQSRVLRGGEAVALDALKKDERVVVSADETSPGRFTAQTVTVVSQGPAPSDRADVAAEGR
jgi:uncharacterized protein YndB with AHSA1/START domain